MDDLEGFTPAGDNDADLDLGMLEELERDREAVLMIRHDIVEALRLGGIDVDSLDLERDEASASPEEIDTSQPPDWAAVAIKTGVEVVAAAVHFGDLRLPNAEFEPRAVEDTFEVKVDAQLTLQDPHMPQEAYEVLRGFLNERVSIRLEPQREAELLNKVAAERESLRPPGPLT